LLFGENGGPVYCWGDNTFGQLGTGDDYPDGSAVPVLVPNLPSVSEIATGGRHTCAVLQSGELRCWGSNDRGQLGTEGPAISRSPTPVKNLQAAGWLVAGDAHTCAVTSEATWCWGMGQAGRLGNGSEEDQPVPVQVSGVVGVTSLSAGFDHTCAISGGPALPKCWGNGFFGQLGNGESVISSSTPVASSVFYAGAQFTVQAGAQHTCVLARVGQRNQISCAGSGGLGQIGDANFENSLTPVVVTGF
jgi:hypothetical protein